jgi:hypothetical protein
MTNEDGTNCWLAHWLTDWLRKIYFSKLHGLVLNYLYGEGDV